MCTEKTTTVQEACKFLYEIQRFSLYPEIDFGLQEFSEASKLAKELKEYVELGIEVDPEILDDWYVQWYLWVRR